jgi:arginase
VAVKIVRQPNKIALLGSPTSAAAMSSGHEGAPVALRAAGLVGRLQSIGYEITDLGDDPPQTFKSDNESPRARNISGVLASLENLKPRVEQAVKSAALPLILTGDCSAVLATVAGLRRYFRHVSLIYMDRDADLNTPATTPSGCLDGMVISHMTGRGAAELVRFWGEPPLVRDPDIALFGVDRIDPPEEEVLRSSPLRRYMADEVKHIGPAAAAQAAVDRIHGKGYECVLHFDVDVIADFEATDYPGTGGLSLADVREALEVFMRQEHLAAIAVAAYNPLKDPDGSGAALIVDLLTDVLGKRLEALQAKVPAPQPCSETEQPSVAAGDAWSSDDTSTPSSSDAADTERSEGQSANPGDTGDPA